MYLHSFPAILPRICCAVTYREKPSLGGKVAIRVIHEVDGEETIAAELEYDAEPTDVEPDPDDPFVMREGKFFFELSPLEIPAPGKLKVRAYRDDDEVRLGALLIGLAPQVEGDTQDH